MLDDINKCGNTGCYEVEFFSYVSRFLPDFCIQEVNMRIFSQFQENILTFSDVFRDIEMERWLETKILYSVQVKRLL